MMVSCRAIEAFEGISASYVMAEQRRRASGQVHRVLPSSGRDGGPVYLSLHTTHKLKRKWCVVFSSIEAVIILVLWAGLAGVLSATITPRMQVTILYITIKQSKSTYPVIQ